MDTIFNLNSEIGVKLTDVGFAIWKSHDDAIFPDHLQKPIDAYKAKADTEGYLLFQAWVFMNIFGEHSGMGFKQAFDINLRLKSKDLKPACQSAEV